MANRKALFSNAGQVQEAAATDSLGQTISGQIANDVTGNSNVTPTDITGLSFAIAAGETWAGVCNLRFTGSAAGFKIEMAGPAAPTSVSLMVGADAPVTAFSTPNTNALGVGSFTGTTTIYWRVVNGTNAGTVKLQFIEVTNLQTSTMRAGSIFLAVKG